MQNKNPSLRDQKRRATRERIEDAATRLVDERGFSDVTVEEICEAANISRRTFFNYFDSKDHAVLGSPSQPFSEEYRQRFLTAETTNVAALAVDLAATAMEGHHYCREVHERRQRIASQPDVMIMSMNHTREKINELIALIAQRLSDNPEEQILPDTDPQTEAMLLGAFIRECWWLTISNPDSDCAKPIKDRFHDAARLISDFTKGLTW